MKRLAAILLVGLGAQALAGAASAVPIVAASTGGGSGCADAACTSQTLAWASSSGGGSGVLDIDGNQLSFTINLSSTTFLPVSGGSDNGVTQLVFTDTTYTGTATLAALGGGYFGIVSGSASISGTQTPSGAGVAGPFAVASTPVSGACQTSGSSIHCGIVFGSSGFALDVNGSTRHFAHTVNASAVPEPGAPLLYGLGLLVAGGAGRARRRSARDR